MKLLSETATAQPDSHITWCDAEWRLTIDFPARILSQIADACSSPLAPEVGVLLGSGQDSIRVHNAFIIDLDRDGRLSPTGRDRLASCLPQPGRAIATVGLFACGTPDDSTRIQRLATVYKRIVPSSMPILMVGKQTATVFLWNAVSEQLVPLQPPLSFPPVQIAEETTPKATNKNWNTAPETIQQNSALRAQGAVATTQTELQTRPQTERSGSNLTVHFELPRRVWIGAVLLVLCLLVLGLFWWRSYGINRVLDTKSNQPVSDPVTVRGHSTDDSGLNLQVARRGTDLLISWDRTKVLMLEAQDGLLEIRDGTGLTSVPMMKKDLAAGQILYVPKSRDIEIMIAAFTGTRIVRETLRVLHAATTEQELTRSRSNDLQPPRSLTVNPQSPPPVRTIDMRAAASSPGAPAQAVQPPAQGSEARQLPARVEPQQSASAAEPIPTVDMLANARRRETLNEPTLERKITDLPAGPAPIQQLQLPAAPPKETSAPPKETSVAKETSGATLETRSAARSATSPVPIRKIQPVLPHSIKSLLFKEVLVPVKLNIDAEGKVVSTHVTAGNSVFLRHMGNVAADAALHWRFQPATLDGQQVASEYVITFRFKR